MYTLAYFVNLGEGRRLIRIAIGQHMCVGIKLVAAVAMALVIRARSMLMLHDMLIVDSSSERHLHGQHGV